MLVESNQLLAFYRSLTAWPATDADVGQAAEKIARVIRAPLVAVVLTDGAPVIGLRAAESSAAALPNPELLKELVRKHASGLESGASSLRHIELNEGLPGYTLTIASVIGDVSPSGAVRDMRVRRDFGHVIVASERPLPPKEEILLVAVAQRLAELAESAQCDSALQLRSQFLSIASHELKTPLTSIYGMLQLQERMLRAPAPKAPGSEAPGRAQVERDKQKFFLKKIIRQVERLNELIDDLLDVSRIQNGRFMVEPSDTDVAAVLREAVSSRLDLISGEQGVKIHVDAPERLVAWVDPVRMEEIITNLVMNAIRFSPEGGVVWVKLREDGDAFRLTVRDQGPSVAMEDRERIFRPFERAQRTSRLGGLGLGLFISRQIAQLHGGNVSLVESVPGKGNVFEAHIPMRGMRVISA